MASAKLRSSREVPKERASRKRQARRSKSDGSWLKRLSLPTLVVCALAIYVVVKNVDRVKEVHALGVGLTFQDKSPDVLPAAEQRERSHTISKKLEADVQKAPAPQLNTAVDLTGTWTTPDDAVSWTITIENGFVVFREQYAATPGIVSAVGYGPFDGHTWSPRFETILGATGAASLTLAEDGTLNGEATIAGDRFSLTLQR